MSRSGVLLYIFSVFLSAWLVFWMEPLYAKMLLPLFGGSPNVWVTSLMFFQAVLLAGYIYAHLLIRLPNPLLQGTVHLGVALVAVASLPPSIVEFDAASLADAPLLSILSMLGRGIAMPMFVLSATAPLLQYWFSLSGHERAADPYFLYAVSNLGSFGALLAFPFVLEPTLPLASQSILWGTLFCFAVVMILGCGYLVRDGKPAPATAVQEKESNANAASTPSQWLWWMALSAVPCSLLAGTTTLITTDIGSVPLLWVVPLMVFLGTFILAFAGIRLFSTMMQRVLMTAAIAGTVIITINDTGDFLGFEIDSVAFLVPFFLTVQFIFSFACNKALYNRRPETASLTGFYVAVAVGGLMGGAFNAVVAPLIFTNPADFSIALVLALALSRQESDLFLPATRAAQLAIAVPLGIAFLAVLLAYVAPSSAKYLPEYLVNSISDTGFWSAMAIALVLLIRFPLIQAGALALVFFSTSLFLQPLNEIYAERNFFGTLRVINDYESQVRFLVHGTTNHGEQNLDPAKSKERLSYFGTNSPISDVFKYIGDDPTKKSVGVVGLGTGTLSCYRRPGQQWLHFEIDPAVVRIARNGRFFTFLSECDPSASVENGTILLGDARQQIERRDDRFDVLVLDAFTSDAIPLHLLTLEAFQTYAEHLAPNGVLAVHISNRYIDLRGTIARSAAELGLGVIQGVGSESDGRLLVSVWVVLSFDGQALRDIRNNPDSLVSWHRFKATPDAPLWTDDYSNIFTSLY